ncbi:vacuolar protein sorting protein 4 [Guillardia theta CCMP2712]|uniref:Vacuolar protein sorting protein 4 n=2 Tax=Guillardia theta TaxID=55529 RepID=L1IBZ1_GUITC|nr:vacuolar protein sorting protein 4 [Guillardia theta CCMP2712]EKX33345.1 vacuolar protein sorting protein 4 [Guillardia theta CCMP2712]|eukprot:XP_005820325.1 vacuolar protein sorting protein 4 [Guillardia theta CCMP2712]
MATVDFKAKAIEKARIATELDKEATALKDPADWEKQREKYDEALHAYRTCLDTFMTAMKWEKNPNITAQLRKFAKEYMERAEKIQEILKDPPKAKKAAVPAGGDSEKEKGRMRDAIQSAIVQEKPNVRWEDIAGLEQAKEALKEAVILPINFPQLFQGSGRKPWSGIMLYGPPGTGKSFLAKAVATEASATFLSVSSADLTSKWLGESEKLVKMLFETAREQKPSIIFIDEIDSIATSRNDSDSESGRRIKTELLVQMDGLGNSLEGLLVLCATNLPWAIDSAVRRRCQRRIYIPLPDERARRRLLDIHLSKMDPKPGLEHEQLQTLVSRTDGFSGSDIAVLIRDAVMEPVRRCQDAQAFKRVMVKNPEGVEEEKLMPCSPSDPDGEEMTIMDLAKNNLADKLVAPPVSYRDFEKTLARCKPSVSLNDLQEFEKFTKEYGQEG